MENVHICNLVARGKTLAEAKAIASGKPQSKPEPKAPEPSKPAPSEVKTRLAESIKKHGGTPPPMSKSVKAFEAANAEAAAAELAKATEGDEEI
jgi:hypothetical protein